MIKHLIMYYELGETFLTAESARNIGIHEYSPLTSNDEIARAVLKMLGSSTQVRVALPNTFRLQEVGVNNDE